MNSTANPTSTAAAVAALSAGSGVPLFRCIDEDLRRVEECLLLETRSDIGAVRDISGHTLLSGGKRLRPALAVLSARAIERQYPEDRATAAAAAAEMIHMATLMHDDVVDGSAERRGRPTANSVFGNGITVLTGDFLLAKSMSLLAHNDDNLAVIRVFSDVTVAMAEGEVLQNAIAHDPEIRAETYEQVIERKTARFLAGCCETGAMLGGGTREEAVALRAYGHHLGMAFQIADDLLDLVGDPQKTGKPLGTDLRDGRVTLPLIHSLRTADAETGARLRELVRKSATAELSDADIAAITGAIARYGGFAAARQVAEERAERAVAALDGFPASLYLDSLKALAAYVVARDR